MSITLCFRRTHRFFLPKFNFFPRILNTQRLCSRFFPHTRTAGGKKMQKFKGHLTAALFGILAGAMLAYPQQAADAAQQALTLWARAVVPVLGPFMVCAVMLSGRLGSSIAPCVVTAWLCGSPGGAKIFQSFRLSRKNALHYAAVTGTMSPMFFLGTVSGWLGNPAAGLIIFLCQCSNLPIQSQRVDSRPLSVSS